MKKTASTVRVKGNYDFQKATQAHDWSRPRRSLVVPTAFWMKGAKSFWNRNYRQHREALEADAFAKIPRSLYLLMFEHRNTFPLGQPAVNWSWDTKCSWRNAQKGAIDHQEQAQR